MLIKNEKLICRIEGHGKLKIDLKKNKAKLVIDEGERLFEQLVVSRDYQEAPFIAARICGVCPVAHTLASIKALEVALDIKMSQLVLYLRKLMLYAQIIQSHLLHLFFLSLPDYAGLRSAAELISRYPSLYHLILNIKRVTDTVLETIGARVVHPITPTIGGFLKMPDRERLLSLILDFESVLDEAQDLVRTFAGLKYPKMAFDPLQLCLSDGKSYSVYEGEVVSNRSLSFDPAFYKDYIKEEVNYESSAKSSRLGREGFMVGAEARVNLRSSFLSPKAAVMLAQANMSLPLKNPFLNNFCQSLEILHFLEEMIKILYFLAKDSEIWQQEILMPVKNNSGKGAAAIEAPRGTLYYWFVVKEGKVTACDIVTPTAQNLTSLEQAANQLLKANKDQTPKRKGQLLAMLIRAFDPCITCSVH